MSNPWEERARRAVELARAYPFASELLHFYAEVSRFQASLQGSRDAAGFALFLAMVERAGTSELATRARELRAGAALPEDVSATGADAFFARAFLQPHFADGTCPGCADWQRHAVCGVLREQRAGAGETAADGAARSLVCAFCLRQRPFRRAVCPACGNEDGERLVLYTAGQFPHIRVEACEDCRVYVKTVDVRMDNRAIPDVDELAAAPLDLWARQRGYRKLIANLLGF